VGQAVGLSVPRSPVTNRADAARRFAAEVAGPVVVKPLGYASIIEHGVRRALYTRVLTDDDLADLGGIGVTAHLFQRYIEDKVYELRLTVVGDRDDERLFPVAIRAGSDASRVDFRVVLSHR
jgi:glutathione synthase/RimK-type ligase-like ATP-grasp enzyme